MRLKNYLFAAITMLGCAWPFAGAGAQLGFGPAVFNKDTFNIGDTLRITSFVHNFDTATYHDYISFGLKINGIQNVNQVLFPNPYYDQVININPGDSIIANMTIIITSAYFELGPDILVIWPLAPDGSLPVFSIDSSIYVRKPVGIDELNDNKQLKAYYTDKFIYLKAEAPGIVFNRVHIFDLSGREILNESTDGMHPIPFSQEASGIYFLALDFNDGQTRVLKVVK
jgi:hypothetical protein